MDEIDGAVGFQQVAPGPLTRIGLAGNQQHPQPVAHAVDLDDGGVVAVRQLALRGVERQLHDVLAAVVEHQRQLDILPDGHGDDLFRRTVHGDAQGDGPSRESTGHLSLLVDAQRQAEGFADDAEGRGGLDQEPAVPIPLVAGQQDVQRCRHVRSEIEVMHLSVRDEDRPRHPRARFLRQRLRQGGHGERAGIVGAIGDGDLAQFGVGQRRDLGLDPADGGGGLFGAVGDLLARAFVDDQQYDIGKRPAFLGLQRGLGDGGQQAGGGERPQPPAAQAAPGGEGDHDQRQRRTRPKNRPRQQRIEDHLPDHWPSLSRSAGTWT